MSHQQLHEGGSGADHTVRQQQLGDGEGDRLLPMGRLETVPGSNHSSAGLPPPRLRQVLFFATYILYYAANTLMGPLLPSSKNHTHAVAHTALLSTCLVHLGAVCTAAAATARACSQN
jgi:hypothetical protein